MRVVFTPLRPRKVMGLVKKTISCRALLRLSYSGLMIFPPPQDPLSLGDLRRAKACFCQILGLVGWGSSSKAQVLESSFYLGQVSNLWASVSQTGDGKTGFAGLSKIIQATSTWHTVGPGQVQPSPACLTLCTVPEGWWYLARGPTYGDREGWEGFLLWSQFSLL